LIGGFDESTATQLASLLRAGRHDVQICEVIQTCNRPITELDATIDLVVVDGTAGFSLVEKYFKSIACVYAGRGRRAMLLCVSRVYHGPRFEIDLESEGHGLSMSIDLRPVIYKAEALLLERSLLATSGPRFRVIHRFRIAGTSCQAGEEVFAIFLMLCFAKIPSVQNSS
jgi:hypothetical protein